MGHSIDPGLLVILLNISEIVKKRESFLNEASRDFRCFGPPGKGTGMSIRAQVEETRSAGVEMTIS